MALQSIWWRDISKDPLFEPLQAKFQPERTHSSRLVVIWSEIGAQKSALPSRQRATSRQWQNYELSYELIPHPPYSPDLAPCDFFLFSNLKTWLGGKKFLSNEEVIVAVNEYFADFETGYFKWLPNVNYVLSGWNLAFGGIRRVDLSRCRVIKWIVAPFHGNLPNLSNDPRTCLHKNEISTFLCKFSAFFYHNY